MLKKLIRYARGSLRFRLCGPFPERFLNLCARGGVSLWDPLREENTLTASCALCHRSRIEYYAEKSGATLTILQSRGARETASRYRRRLGLWVGAAVLILGILVMGRFLWQVEIRGIAVLPEEEVRTALAEYGVHAGVLARGVDARSVERRMQVRFPGIAWIAVNIEGSHASIVIEETVQPPDRVEDGIPTNVVADRTGFIVSVECYDGSPAVKPGDSVRQGDLLISGVMDNAVGESRTVHARGQIKALSRETISVTVPYSQEHLAFRGIARRRFLSFFGVSIPLQAAGAPPSPYRLEKRESAPQGIFALLPVRLSTERYLLQEVITEEIDLPAAQIEAEKELLQKETRAFSGRVIHSREVTGVETEAGYTLIAEYLCEGEIGVERPFAAQESPLPAEKSS